MDIVRAHQYLYYVKGIPIWNDIEYDTFCKVHNVPGQGGSDLAEDYESFIVLLAGIMARHPEDWEPDMVHAWSTAAAQQTVQAPPPPPPPSRREELIYRFTDRSPEQPPAPF
jgi:hypothetical protein